MINKHGVDLSKLRELDDVVIGDRLITVTEVMSGGSLLCGEEAGYLPISEPLPFIKLLGSDLWRETDDITAIRPYRKYPLHEAHVARWYKYWCPYFLWGDKSKKMTKKRNSRHGGIK